MGLATRAPCVHARFDEPYLQLELCFAHRLQLRGDLVVSASLEEAWRDDLAVAAETRAGGDGVEPRNIATFEHVTL